MRSITDFSRWFSPRAIVFRDRGAIVAFRCLTLLMHASVRWEKRIAGTADRRARCRRGACSDAQKYRKFREPAASRHHRTLMSHAKIQHHSVVAGMISGSPLSFTQDRGRGSMTLFVWRRAAVLSIASWE
jgi:hypothetical protein